MKLNLNEMQRHVVYAALVEYQHKMEIERAGKVLRGEDVPGVVTCDVKIAAMDELFQQLYHIRGTIQPSN